MEAMKRGTNLETLKPGTYEVKTGSNKPIPCVTTIPYVTKMFKVYGKAGHRQRESFNKSTKSDFSTEGNVRIIETINSDETGTNDYSIIRITRKTEQECYAELAGRLSDGTFENSRYGRVTEIMEDGSEKEYSA